MKLVKLETLLFEYDKQNSYNSYMEVLWDFSKDVKVNFLMGLN